VAGATRARIKALKTEAERVAYSLRIEPQGVPVTKEPFMLLQCLEARQCKHVTCICDGDPTLVDASPSIDREAVASIVLRAMQDKVGSDTYGVSYALNINTERAGRAADAILALSQPGE